ncbi:MAG TPA: putative zinc-binding metallopeptidase [bacterium]|nr:putative zinc-binding metallopeptidase [bacterium]HOL46687.1 putative zinc-binding metallopeptidase [bacterium]HPQ18375.1 putative zinc-binding metallopeptidase [bacterium]
MRKTKKSLYNLETIKSELLNTPINKLGLKIEGSILEQAIDEVYKEIEENEIILRPNFYLSDSYGCCEGTANIGLAFWDANEILREIVYEVKKKKRSYDQLLNLIRHEFGHAFCYSYKLYRENDFRELFEVEGNFFRTYPDHNNYKPNPWSRNYVNPDGDYYAQKHPDDDFAETFAVYLNKNEDWRSIYKNRKGALRKIFFVKSVIRKYGKLEPFVLNNPHELHIPISELDMTVADFLKCSKRKYLKNASGFVDFDLKKIFKKNHKKYKSKYKFAVELIKENKQALIKKFIGLYNLKSKYIISDLIEKIENRLNILELVFKKVDEDNKLLDLTMYISKLVNNYLLTESYL